MIDMSEKLARRVRDAMGDFNDPAADVVGLVKWMSGEIERHRDQLHLANIDACNLQADLTAAEAVVEAAREIAYQPVTPKMIEDLRQAVFVLDEDPRTYDAARGNDE